MPLARNPDGTWTLRANRQDKAKIKKYHPAYVEALPRYMTAFDLAFSHARDACEFEFILCLLRVRGLQDAGWDPYETTQNAIPGFLKLHAGIRDFETSRHLQLWTYGHIVEASEPYELLANLIQVAQGGRFNGWYFPLKKNGRLSTPGGKIEHIARVAVQAGLSDVVAPLRECWNRDLRNSIFHADYALYKDEVRTSRPMNKYSHEEILTLTNRSIAYQEALSNIYKTYVGLYTAPVVIPVHPEFSPDPDEKAVVIVRSGYGVVGLKDAWEPEQLRAGRIPFRIGRFTVEEIRRLDQDPALALLPPRKKNKNRLLFLLANIGGRVSFLWDSPVKKLAQFFKNKI